ncbi:MAG: sensor histidine kinase [Alistipes sp.]|nr:sensor histidine kinase [Alistipes sp.]
MKLFRRWELGENMLYTLVWVAIFLIPFMNAQLMSEHEIDFNKVIISWVKVAPYFTIFLVNNILLAPKLLLRHRYWLYSILLLVMLFSIFATIEILDFRYWQSIDELRDKASFTDLAWYWNVLLGVFMAGANSMIKLYYRTLDTERRMAVLEKQNIETQMEYLKYQINPHFRMNTLNNIHSLIDFDADMARKSVMELSHMLRHILYDSSESSTTLDKEITFLESYIKLMRIRYIDEVNITFSHPDIPACARIKLPPLLLIVLVENAFKHGISYKNASFININITIDHNELTCIVANSRHDNDTQSTERSGIGLNNIIKRMDILFGSSYTLTTDSTDSKVYIVELVIPVTTNK